MTVEAPDDGIEMAPAARAPSLGARLAAVLDWACASHRRACLALAALALVCFLPGFFNMPPVDRDESRFAQATKQMLETGDFVDIRFQDEARHKKPVGIYWIQSAVVGAAEAVGVPQARTRIWLYRLPSLAGTVGGVLLVYWTALAFVGRRHAVLAAAMLASCILLGVEARLAKTDAMLFLTIVAAQGALAHAFMRRDLPAEADVPGIGWRLALIFWGAIGAGALLKGPIILLVVGLTAVVASALTRSWRWLLSLKPLAGVPLALLVVLPWYVAIHMKTGGAFFEEAVGRDLVGKVREGQENHWAPPGAYLLAVWFTFWPAAPLMLFALPATWRARFEPRVLFLLAWLVPTWLVFEIVPTKLPHYVLPLLPAAAILVAMAMERDALDSDGRWWTAGGRWWWPALAILVPVAALIGLLVFHRGAGFAAWPFLAAAGVLGFKAVETLREEGTERAFLVSILAAIAVYVAVLQVLLPATRTYFPARALVAAAAQAGCDNPQIASAGYREPSLVFLAGTDTELVDAVGAAEFLHLGGCRIVFVDARQQRTFAIKAESLGVRYRLLTVIKAANYNGGRRLNLSVFARVDP